MCKLFLTALPKTGIHLMRQLLNTKPFPDTLIPTEKQDNVSAFSINEYREDISLTDKGRRHQHIPFTRKRAAKLKDAVGFMIVRDPRDVIVSHAHYIDRIPNKTWVNYHITDLHRLSDVSFEKRVDWLLKLMPVRLSAYNGWVYQENVHVFKYRELVQNQRKQILRMMAILARYNLLDANYDEMVDRARPNPSGAFRRGKVGDYKHAFTETQKRMAENLFGDFIEAWS